jgi:hypothetical protein
MITTDTIPALELAKLLAHKLARVTGADAFVVNDDGHPLLACADDIGADASALRYWTQDQVIFTAPAPE